MNMYTGNQSTVTEFIFIGLSSDPLVQIILFPIFLIIYLTAVTGNLLLIVAVWTDKRLHTSMYRFLSNLSFLDICFTSSVVPQTLVHLFLMIKTISFDGCMIQLFFSLLFGETECFILASMAYDRYVAICSPLRYNMIMNRRVSLLMISASWLAGFTLAFLDTCFTFTLKFCGSNAINHFLCEFPLLLQLSCSDISAVNILKLVGASLLLFIPIPLILLSYMRIIVTVVKLRAGKSKAFSTCLSHLVVMVLFYGTTMFMYSKPEHLITDETDKRVAVFYTMITPMLNPLFYSLRNKEVQRAARRLIGNR